MGDKNFPKTIFVQRDGEGEETYLATYEELDGIDDDTIVAVYELRDVKRMKVSSELVEIGEGGSNGDE